MVFWLSQSNRNVANPNASMPLVNKMMTEPQGEKSAALPIANPPKAFIACVAGRICAAFLAPAGSML